MSDARISLQVLTAYTSLLEQARIESFFHACGAEDDVGGSSDGGGDDDDDDEEHSDAGEGANEQMKEMSTDVEGDQSGDNDADQSVDDVATTKEERTSEANADEPNACDWSDSEINAFFRSLARRTRLRPDLIAEDMHDCKSTAQVVHLIRLLDEGAAERMHDPLLRDKYRRTIKRCPSAIEVSPQWVELEEQLAEFVRAEQEVRDSGTRDDVVSWDEQVLNVALFLRHYPDCDPDSKSPNVSVSAASQDGTPAHVCARTWTFSAQKAFNAISGQGISSQDKNFRSYVLFSYDHSVPHVPRQYPVNTSLVPWRLIYRCIEMGLLSCVTMTGEHAGADDALLPIAVIRQAEGGIPSKSTASERRFQRDADLMLIWTETISNIASELLDEHRRAAATRLFTTLKFRELRVISAGLMAGLDERVRTNDASAEDAAEDACNSAEEATTCGKRKRMNERQDKAKKRDFVLSESSAVEDEWAANDNSSVASHNALLRFSQIGLKERDVVRQFLDAVSDDVSVLDLRVLTRMIKAAEDERRQQVSHDGLQENDARRTLARLSIETMEHLALRVRSFIEAVVAQIESNVSHVMRATEVQGAKFFLVSDEHVRKALQRVVGANIMLLGESAADVLCAGDNEHSFPSAVGLQNVVQTITRSDPPSYPSHALLQVQSKGQEMYISNLQNYLQGIKTLARGSWTLHDAASYAGVRHDGLVSVTDGLVVPDWNGHSMVSGSKARDDDGEQDELFYEDEVDEDEEMNDASDEGDANDTDGLEDDAESIYEGSDDERVVLARRDVRRGKLPDRIRNHDSTRQTSYRIKLEKRREVKMNIKDDADAKVQEALLWNYVGVAQPLRMNTNQDDGERSSSSQEIRSGHSMYEESGRGDGYGDEDNEQSGDAYEAEEHQGRSTSAYPARH